MTTRTVDAVVVPRTRVRGTASRLPAGDPFSATMLAMLSAASEELSTPVGRVSLYPGAEVVWDDCCAGQLWVRMLDMVPSGTELAPAQPCGVPAWSALFGIGVVRCVSALDDNGRPPTPSALTDDTMQIGADRVDILRALSCVIPPMVEKLTIVNWLPLGPDGACAGGEWQFRVVFTSCAC